MSGKTSPFNALLQEKARLSTLKGDLKKTDDIGYLEDLRLELDKISDEIAFDLGEIFKRENDIKDDFRKISVKHNEDAIEINQANYSTFIEDMEDEIEDVLEIIERVENLARKGKLRGRLGKKRILKTMGDLLIASTIVISKYASPTEVLSFGSISTALVLVLLGAMFIKKSKNLNSRLFFESFLISVIACIGLSFLVGLMQMQMQMQTLQIIFTIAFTSLPSVLIFDAIMQ
ncbi:MAG: hypothetical protein ACFFCS_18970 [Candidatus Hodarchaeota archaeon]